MASGRYRVTVTSAGQPVMRGWWGSEAVARDKSRRWIGEYGDLPDARITLTDEETGTVLTTWPEEP
ncbi:hypothetical protein ACH4JS_26565 [Streptomyces sp. NPDC017638]|uniref:hypothetical protein n=1 Tax=Streptomyces sp. NPDC017638 TaxID=3365004 RepID=UPI0037965C67